MTSWGSNFKSNALLFLLALLALVNLNTNAQERTQLKSNSPSSVWSKGKYSIDLGARSLSFEELEEKAQLIQLSLNPSFDLPLSSWFKLKGEAGINLNSARVQSRFQDSSTNSIVLEDLQAIISTHPDIYELAGGAINQSHLNSPLLVESRAFPGIMAKVGPNEKEWFGQVKVQSTIPTSSSLDSDRIEKEKDPVFSTAGLELAWLGNFVQINYQANYFEFSDLPSRVAFESGTLGNSIIGTESSESRFVYNFKGFSQSANLVFVPESIFSPGLRIQTIENADAPEGNNRAQWVSINSKIKFNQIHIKPEFSYFYSEPDSSPAFYNSASLGHNNRVGNSFLLNLEFEKLGFNLGFNYTQAKTINEHPDQSDFNSFMLSVEIINGSI